MGGNETAARSAREGETEKERMGRQTKKWHEENNKTDNIAEETEGE